MDSSQNLVRCGPPAADYFHQALTIVEPLIASESVDLDSLYAAADAYSGLGRLSLKKAEQGPGTAVRKNWAEARSWFQQSLNTWGRIAHPNHTAPNSFLVGDPVAVARELRVTEAALSSRR